MTRMVASDIESLLKEYGYSITIKDITEDTLSGNTVRSSIVHAVNQKIQSVLIIRIRSDGSTRIRFTMPADKSLLDTIILRLEDHGFNVDIVEGSIDVIKRVTINELINTLKELLSIVSNP